ncbi:MAG: LLM class flavin-dependent oxidoreductase [Chloroflexi bacterium]|nr:LLM class flavin-dependent oxidoreductase [Chloroflexota bacterium]
MRYGISVPNFGAFGDARFLGSLARDAEASGWDGFFLWDHVAFYPAPHVDPWVAMAAIALATRTIRLGALVTPLPRRRPVKFARETVSIDRLSEGRLIVGVGSGAGVWEFDHFGEEGSARVRAEMLDEALELVTRLWTGQPVLHEGKHYRFQGDGGPADPTPRATALLPAAVQRPRIPVWVAGSLPFTRPFIRAARWDGVVPIKSISSMEDDGLLQPEDTRQVVALIRRHRPSDAPFDVTASGRTSGTDPVADRARVVPYAEAGATWWIEDVHPWACGWNWQGEWPVDALVARVRRPPPR